MLEAGSRLGPFAITSLLGVGGMGEVYRARDERLGRDVAVKILPPVVALDPERRARFQREARVLASLNHPNIAAIHGIEEHDGFFGLVLEFVDGETLADVVARGPLGASRRFARRSHFPMSAGVAVGRNHRSTSDRLRSNNARCPEFHAMSARVSCRTPMTNGCSHPS